MRDKKGFEFSFAWMFALFVGAVVLFLGIYAATNLIKTERFETDTKTAAQLGVLLNPVETNLEAGRFAVIEFPEETRLFNNCREEGNFGEQGIRTSVKSGIGDTFKSPGAETIFFNKYIFSEKREEGKELYVFVKPFEFPYKVADLILASSDSYCFITPPSEIEEEIDDLQVKNIKIAFSAKECNIGEKKVCFNLAGCDVDVSIERKEVVRNGKTVSYEGSLIYGAIFAHPDIYECQVKRLMRRTSELAKLYSAKTEFLSTRGCSSNLANDLANFAMNLEENTQSLSSLSFQAEEIWRRNDELSCRLF